MQTVRQRHITSLYALRCAMLKEFPFCLHHLNSTSPSEKGHSRAVRLSQAGKKAVKSLVQKVFLHQAVVSDEWLVTSKNNMLPEVHKAFGLVQRTFCTDLFQNQLDSLGEEQSL